MSDLLANHIYHGDALDILRTIPDNSIDSVVTDPPYGLSKEPDIVEVLTKWLNGEDYEHRGGGFMGKSWDSFVPGPSTWREVNRVLKPGGFALVFAGTRTQDLMTTALRIAGFRVVDVIEWLYLSGFPKAGDISTMFDKRAGAEREVIGKATRSQSRPNSGGIQKGNGTINGGYNFGKEFNLTVPVTPLAQQWNGWKTPNLKPAHEPIIFVQKKFNGTYCDNIEKWGTGAINVEQCRIPYDGTEDPRTHGGTWSTASMAKNAYGEYAGKRLGVSELGRFPANCITTDDDAWYSKYFNITPRELSKKTSKRDRNSDWQGNPIDGEKRIANPNYGSGGFSRPTGQPERQIQPQVNYHPTVKPTDLMAWLIRLVTPPGGIVLDPFAGSGSTLVAAKREWFQYIGIEREQEYIDIARKRLQ